MKNMTLRGIDDALAKELKKVARREGKSVNQVVVDTLKKRCGLEKDRKHRRMHHDMDHLFGRWSRSELDKIQSKIDAQRRIDPELWP